MNVPKNLTASKLSGYMYCPGFIIKPMAWIDLPTKHQAIGSALHDDLAQAATRVDNCIPENTVADRFVSRIVEEHKAVKILPEISFGYNGVKVVRLFGSGPPRTRYREGYLCGTPDLILSGRDLAVYEYKSSSSMLSKYVIQQAFFQAVFGAIGYSGTYLFDNWCCPVSLNVVWIDTTKTDTCQDSMYRLVHRSTISPAALELWRQFIFTAINPPFSERTTLEPGPWCREYFCRNQQCCPARQMV